MDSGLDELLALARRAATAPAKMILAGYRNPLLQVDLKADGSVVTPSDRDSERLIRQIVASAGPWPLLGEEFALGELPVAKSSHRWVLDPIDGTLGYTRGLPTFGTLLAFESVAPQRALVGAIHLPAAAETYSAARGTGRLVQRGAHPGRAGSGSSRVHRGACTAGEFCPGPTRGRLRAADARGQPPARLP